MKLCDVYNTAMEKVEKDRPELKDHFTRNAGSVANLKHFLPLSCPSLSPSLPPSLTHALSPSLLLSLSPSLPPSLPHSLTPSHSPFLSSSFVTGIEFREGSLLISPKCQMPVRKGMLFNVNVGLSDLTNTEAEDAAGKTYSLFIGDTVLVSEVSEFKE